MLQNKPKNLFFKLSILFFLMILSIIPRLFINYAIDERRQYQTDAEFSVTDGWATRPTLGVVNLNIPYTFVNQVPVKKENSEEILRYNSVLAKEIAAIPPQTLHIATKSKSDIRHRGIFEIPVHLTSVDLSAAFVVPSDLNPSVNDETWSRTEQTIYLSLGNGNSFAVSDFEVELNGKKVASFRDSSGIYLKDLNVSPGQSIEITAHLNVVVTRGLDFTMNANQVEVNMQSNWPHPSFRGLHPASSNINNNGFSAVWKLTQPTLDRGITVDLINPVNIYSESTRALKYGFLITLLTLSVLFLIETLNKINIHPMQYLLLTLPLACFYILLLALSEQIGFQWSYFASSTAVIILIVVYFLGIGAGLKSSTLLGVILATTYGLIDLMLNSEDFALITGAICLFAALSSFMILTRKVDWGNLMVGRTLQ